VPCTDECPPKVLIDIHLEAAYPRQLLQACGVGRWKAGRR
jgi:hypothetical protein